jgi:hypothetical protein
MNRQCHLIGFVLSILSFVGCAQSVAGPTDSETHFLHNCIEYCGQGLACICGVCTKVCDDDESCSALPGDPTCVAPALLENARKCRPSDPIEESVCDVGCKSDSECKALGRDFRCQKGFCREGTVIGADSSLPDQGVPAESETAIDIPDTISGEDREVTTAEDAVLFGGLALGERAPAIGDVPWNAYGGPVEPVSMEVHYPRFYGTYPVIENLSLCDGTTSLGTLTLEDLERQPCVMYFLCENYCLNDISGTVCDDGGSGNATPVCNQDTCELICDDQRTCPDGMVCVTDDSGSKCWWPLDIAAPDCPAWCETDPLPRDCPDWCASKGVECGADYGVCCEGLTCGSGGLCVEEM